MVLCWSATACTPADDRSERTPATVTKKVSSGPRHDLAPLLSRFPLLAGASSAVWASGDYDAQVRGVPGPSVYWIDAVVVVGAAKVDDWATRYETAPESAPTDVAETMRAHLPAGPLSTSPELGDAFSTPEWRARVYLSATTGSVIVLATDD